MCGATVDWSNATERAIYTAPTNINGLVVSHIIAKNPVGLQPASILIKVNGVLWGASVPLLTLTANTAQVMPTPTSLLPVLQSGQVISVTPVAALAGSLTFDVLGFFY